MAKHGNIVAQATIYSMWQQGTFPEFGIKLNVTIFQLTKHMGGTKVAQI